MKYFFLLITFFSIGVAFSQTIVPCATPELSQQQKAFLKDFQSQPQATLRANNTIYLPVKVHVLGNDAGEGYLEKSDIFRIICDLNQDYTTANIYFYLYGDINYINRTSWYDHDWIGGFNMMSSNNVAQAINVYFVQNASGACGYYSPANDAVAITNSCAGINSTTLAHEIGHYLSMPHTFSGWEGHDMSNPIPQNQQERVDRSNCTTAGDGFCDTPSDFISDRWNCPYGGPALLDPNGDTVIPDGTNYMSYSNDACQANFSGQQIAAMRAYITQSKGNITGNASNGFVTLFTPVKNAPANAETLPTTEVTFKWNKVANATKYHLEVSPLTTMIAKVVDVTIADTFYTFNQFEPNKNYKWRVKAYAPGNLCTAPTAVTNFNTGSIGVGIPTITATNEVFTIYPNPLSREGQLNIVLNFDKAATGQIEIYSLTGALLNRIPVQISTGINNLALDMSDLNKGVYLVRLNTGEERITRRFVIAE